MKKLLTALLCAALILTPSKPAKADGLLIIGVVVVVVGGTVLYVSYTWCKENLPPPPTGQSSTNNAVGIRGVSTAYAVSYYNDFNSFLGGVCWLTNPNQVTYTDLNYHTSDFRSVGDPNSPFQPHYFMTGFDFLNRPLIATGTNAVLPLQPVTIQQTNNVFTIQLAGNTYRLTCGTGTNDSFTYYFDNPSNNGFTLSQTNLDGDVMTLISPTNAPLIPNNVNTAVIERSTNLTAWVAIATNSYSPGQTITLADFSGLSKAFYRVRSPAFPLQ